MYTCIHTFIYIHIYLYTSQHHNVYHKINFCRVDRSCVNVFPWEYCVLGVLCITAFHTGQRWKVSSCEGPLWLSAMRPETPAEGSPVRRREAGREVRRQGVGEKGVRRREEEWYLYLNTSCKVTKAFGRARWTGMCCCAWMGSSLECPWLPTITPH